MSADASETGAQGLGKVLARHVAQQALLARREAEPHGAADEAAQDGVGVDRVEEDLRRPVQGGERGAPREVGGFLGVGTGGLRQRRRRQGGRSEADPEKEDRRPAANTERRDQCPVAVSVKSGFA